MDNELGNNIEPLLARASQLGILRMLTQGFLLAHQVLNMPIPASISAMIGQDTTVPRLVNFAQQALIQDEPRMDNMPPFMRLVRMLRTLKYSLKLHPDIRYKWHNLRVVYSANDTDWRVIRLPDRLFPLYFILRPFLWFIRHLKKSNQQST
jgi:hypothetical protein